MQNKTSFYISLAFMAIWLLALAVLSIFMYIQMYGFFRWFGVVTIAGYMYQHSQYLFDFYETYKGRV